MTDCEKSQRFREFVYWFGFVALLCLSILVLHVDSTPAEVDENRLLINSFIAGFCFLSMVYTAFLVISAIFSPHFNAEKPSDSGSCTVIVPAYNEGCHVAETLKSLLKSDYPAEKMQIIAVNDGSKDDTLKWISDVVRDSNGRVKLIDLPQNMGKKHALAAGIRSADNEFIITVDSDTVVYPDTIRRMLLPFTEPAIGAVAGSVIKKKNAGNLHSLMCDVMLIFGCNVLRRSQSCYGNVFCTPGALSAYRKSALLPLLDCWLAQKFLGEPSRIGEDRAISTLLLADDWQIVYQPDAVAETSLPESYSGVCRMLLRWTRSDIRENILMSGKVFCNLLRLDKRACNLFVHWLFLCINMLIPLILFPAGLLLLLTTSDEFGYTIALLFCITTFWSLLPALVYYWYRRSLRQIIWAFVFGFYMQFALSWVSVYSFFTMRNSRWLTRG